MDPTKRNAALGLAGLAAVALVTYLLTGRGEGTTCALTAGAVGVVVADVTHGKGASEIVGTTAAGIVVPGACKSMLDSLIEKPDQEITLDLKLPTGDTEHENVLGKTLLSPPPATATRNAGVDLQTAIKCLDWKSAFLFRLCLDGTIEPPS